MQPSLDQVFMDMKERLLPLMPEAEIRLKAELVAEIRHWKKKRNALVLGHNYMEPALFHYVADVTGDSLALCQKAATAEHDVLVFCGVEFMAETAKIINPERTVLIPSRKAGCSLASSITAADVRALKARHPGVPVVTYINTYADVKAETDVCCTSGNAAAIVEALDSDTVIFIPDEYLARNVAEQTGKLILFDSGDGSTPKVDKADDEGREDIRGQFIGWHGKCEVHEKFSVGDIDSVRRQFPDVVVLAHPECPPDVVAASDFAGSTSEMTGFVRQHDASRYLLLTECAMGDNIIAESPDKDILRLCSHRCPHMAQITLEDTLAALQEMRYEVNLAEEVRVKAKASIDRMLEISVGIQRDSKGAPAKARSGMANSSVSVQRL